MGKLHKIRRAIKKNPEEWKTSLGSPKGAYFSKKENLWYSSWFKNSYKKFVKHTLIELGHILGD